AGRAARGAGAGAVGPPAAPAAPRGRPPRAAGTGRRPEGAHPGAARRPRAGEPAMVAPRDAKALLATLPAACYANPAWRGLAYLVRDLAMFAGVTTLLLVVDRPVLLPVLWLAGGLTIGALFVVGHDAAHAPLVPRPAPALPEPPPPLLDGPARVAPGLARLRGVGARPQPRAPRAHRTRRDRLRLASLDTRRVPPARPTRPAAPSRRVVGMGRGPLLP